MCSGILPAKPHPWMKCNSNSPSSPSRDFVRRGNLSPRSCTTRFQTFTLLLLNACKFFKSRLPRSFNLSISQIRLQVLEGEGINNVCHLAQNIYWIMSLRSHQIYYSTHFASYHGNHQALPTRSSDSEMQVSVNASGNKNDRRPKHNAGAGTDSFHPAAQPAINSPCSTSVSPTPQSNSNS